MIVLEGVFFRSTSAYFGVYASGSLHWLMGDRLTSFDVSGEKFHETVHLTGIDEYENDRLEGIGVSGESLFVCRGCQSGPNFEAWVMKWDGKESSWTKLCSVLVDEYSPFAKYYVRPLYFTRDGKIVMVRCGTQLCRYDPEENAIKMFEFDKEMEVYRLATYVESLVSPGNEVVQR
ncbi:hypothetical protein CDL15_Pgr021297 [Punica granatum]|nr:hypothetical protein CDL15_Pgr021297 [Punica granatum]